MLSVKQGCDQCTQTILPLCRKTPNIEHAAPERMYQNGELQGLILAYGLGMKGSENSSCNIYQRDLVEKGYLYIVQPPLYKITTWSGRARVDKYTFSEEEKEEYLREILGIKEGHPTTDQDLLDGKVTIRRFKWLGEMMPR